MIKQNYFSRPVKNGNLETAKWLKVRDPDINIRADNDVLFRQVCENGHLEIAKWFKELYPNINIRVDNDIIFSQVCVKGRLTVAQWLKELYPDIDPVPNAHPFNDDKAFCGACENGHFSVVKWLIEQWPEVDYRKSSGPAFRCAYSSGNIEVIHYITEQNPSHRIDKEGFCWACKNGNLPVVKWFIERYPNLDHTYWDFKAFKQAYENDKISVVNLLKETWPIYKYIEIYFSQTGHNGKEDYDRVSQPSSAIEFR